MTEATADLVEGTDGQASGRPTRLSPDVESELQALTWLNDDVLWAVARSRMNNSKQRRWRRLLEKNQRGALTDPERDPRPKAEEFYILLITPIKKQLDKDGVKTDRKSVV